MSTLLIAVTCVLVVSCCCSLMEAALYAVRLPYIHTLLEAGRYEGKLLAQFKSQMARPVSAILIMNTLANTAGSTLAGAQAAKLFGPYWVGWFSVGMTLAVLVLAEILPKVAGVLYHRPVARLSARPLAWLIACLYPLIWMLEQLTRRLRPSEPALLAPKEEVLQFAKLSAAEGSILKLEAELVERVLRLNEVTAEQLMRPRNEIFELPANATLSQIKDRVPSWPHSRVPIHDDTSRQLWTGLVVRRDVLSQLAQDEFAGTLNSLAHPIHSVRPDMPTHQLLLAFLQRQSHLFAVTNSAGEQLGIVTLEDVMEAMLGRPIGNEKVQNGLKPT